MSNGRGYKRARIDMALHDAFLQIQYPDSKLYHLLFRAYDHCPILLLTEADEQRSYRSWKFYKCWLRDKNCMEVINFTWHTQSTGVNLHEKLSSTRKSLAKWNREDFGHINRRIKYLKDYISHVQSLPCSDSNSNKIQEIIENLSHWERIEAEFWQQRSGDNWILESDNNTTYFHSKANRRRARNNITALRDNSGNNITTLRDNSRNNITAH
ncbi:uncharacterized protein LOC113352059 [Papaver somniferum]|uniref:uncharacterized protein LOC113352059 n=1 Tax=Papaver somniferum TaxID=3469 RepID=UPI000E705643|nr:uncharacterized protein LOC113352059 [Papaver somniferum]